MKVVSKTHILIASNMDMMGVYCIMLEGVIYDLCYIRKPTSILQQCSQVFVDPKSWYTRCLYFMYKSMWSGGCDQVAMLLINPSMHKESMPIIIMLLHTFDPTVDTGVNAFLWKEIFVRIFHYYISIQNPTEKSDGAWISFFKPTKNHKDNFIFFKCGNNHRLSDG